MTPGVVAWSDAVEEILDGDQIVMLAYVTPAKGVVMLPLTNFALHDREAGTVMLTSALSAAKKLERMRKNPRVALAFHTRRHGFTDGPEFVLVQGMASFPDRPDREWLESIEQNWIRFGGPRRFGPVTDRWLRVYHWERVGITIKVERVTVWPDLRCEGAPTVIGAALPDAPPDPQKPPRGGTGPRVRHDRAAEAAAAVPDVLLGWVGADGYPQMAPVEVAGTEQSGIVLESATGLVPPGGRRAGLTAHAFTQHVIGQNQRVHTGWLEAGERIVYAPHTQAAYRLPPWRPFYRLVVGGVTRWRLRQVQRRSALSAPR